MTIKDGYRPEPNEHYRVDKITRQLDTKSGLPCLELQVNIEGRNRNIVLTFDELQDHVQTNQGVVEAIQGAHNTLNSIDGSIREIRKTLQERRQGQI